MIWRIMITGPESTGKSWLAKNLADHYHTKWVPERARTYLETLNRPYRESDLLQIAREQLELEEKLEKEANGIIFCDTGMLVLKVWSEHSYGRCHPWILEQLQKRKYLYSLLPDIDLPWQPDPQREHPHLREYFFELYKKQLHEAGHPYSIISGAGNDRLQNAINVTDRLTGLLPFNIFP